jgi:glutamate-1-semialdehyde 2,1-aminomutase
MEQYDPNRPGALWQSGTFNGNAMTMVAGIAAMDHFTGSEIRRINQLGDQLRDGMRAALVNAGIGGQVTGYGSMVGLHLSSEPVTNYRSAARGDALLKRAIHLGLLNAGVFAAPRLMFCTSTAMDESVINDVLRRFETVLNRITTA